MKLGRLDHDIIAATQDGLPIVYAPYAAIARKLGIDEDILIARIAVLKERGVIRRIAAAPNHFRLGMTANGMTVWDIEDDKVAQLGPEVGALPFVSHCYERPRALPDWPYNIFAMIHGSDRTEVERKRKHIADILGSACRDNDILYSSKILKKTGLRIREKGAL